MINTAIVGMGGWGRTLVEAVQGKSDRLRFVRGVTKEPEEVADFADTHRIRVSTEYDDVLKDPEIEAVALATPHTLHADQIVQAAEAGKQVFAEKPFTLNLADAERAVAACQRAGVVLGVGQKRRWWQPIVEIKRMIDDGELGTVMQVEGNYSHDWLAEAADGTWRTDPVEAPAGGMTGMGIHLVDAYILMLGSITEVRAYCVDRVLNRAAGDTVAVLLKFECGAVGYVGTTLKTPFVWRMQVFGSDGWAETQGENDLTVRLRGQKPETRNFGDFDAVRAELEAFADAIGGRAPFPIPAEHILHNVAAMEAIFKSAAADATVRVDHRL